MKAIIQDRYGEADVLEFGDVEEPVVGEHEVLIRVRAAGAGPDVWHIMAGKPYMARPMLGWSRPKIRDPRLGRRGDGRGRRLGGDRVQVW